MIKKNIFLLIIGLTFLIASEKLFADISYHPISLTTVLQLAEKNSRLLSAANFREIAAAKSINVAQANYFPTLNAEAIDSAGFPGSSGLTDVGGVMGSPYRKGAAAGLVAQQTVFDFGRTAADVETAKYESEYSQQNTKVTQYQVKQLALQTFYTCASFRTQRDTWTQLAAESNEITQQAERFVNTGQRSVVDGDLSLAQTEETQTAEAFFNARLIEATRELAIIMGIPANSFSCPALPDHIDYSLNTNTDTTHSPLFVRSQLSAKIAQAKLQREKAGYYPKIIATASDGALESARLVNKQNYSVGVGVVIPLVDMRSYGDVQRAAALASAQQQDVAAEQQYLEETNVNYDETIDAAKVRLVDLNQELDLANKAFNTAKQRYVTLQGTLIDLREAFRNLARTRAEIDTTREQLLQASGAKALLNGG